MSWIVADRVAELQAEGRVYGRYDWQRFCRDAGLVVIHHELPPTMPALIMGSTLILRTGLSRLSEAYWAWHEIGHHVLHAGNREFWRTRPMGRHILAKHERQADAFARGFPGEPTS